jgi:hypothetical protein
MFWNKDVEITLPSTECEQCSLGMFVARKVLTDPNIIGEGEKIKELNIERCKPGQVASRNGSSIIPFTGVTFNIALSYFKKSTENDSDPVLKTKNIETIIYGVCRRVAK